MKITKGQLLLSEPFLKDAHFERTVILLCEHNRDGSVGFVFNKKSDIALHKAVDGFDLTAAARQHLLYVGGPVETQSVHFVHRLGSRVADSTRVTRGTFWGGAFEQVQQRVLHEEVAPTDVRFFAGYAGWAPQQLSQELRRQAWIVGQVPDELLWKTPAEALWREVLLTMGGRYRMMANYPIDPRLN